MHFLDFFSMRVKTHLQQEYNGVSQVHRETEPQKQNFAASEQAGI